MELIDLTHSIENGMPVYPGTENLEMENSNTIEKDGFKEKIIRFCSHTGTHMDAPSHMISNGKNLDDFNCNQFIGKALMISIDDQENITDYEDKLKDVDYVIFKTGWSKYWGEKKYFSNFPCLDIDTVKYLVSFNLKGLGFDTISIDPINSNFENHVLVFNNDMIIIENMCNLDKIKEDIFELIVLPLNIKGADGSPVRSIARVY